MKILRPVFSGVAGIFFPIGSPADGGTCQDASDVCLKKCYALKKDYDETLNISEEDKREIHRVFTSEPIITVCNEVLKEMQELQAQILSWFISGDCLDRHIDRLHKIMVLLNEEGIVQNGFTRNKKLYHTMYLGEIIRNIVLTVESKKDALTIMEYPKGLWGIPDYKRGAVKLYYGKMGYQYTTCGFNEVVSEFEGKEITIATNCSGCYKKKIGCFMDFTKDSQM